MGSCIIAAGHHRYGPLHLIPIELGNASFIPFNVPNSRLAAIEGPHLMAHLMASDNSPTLPILAQLKAGRTLPEAGLVATRFRFSIATACALSSIFLVAEEHYFVQYFSR